MRRALLAVTMAASVLHAAPAQAQAWRWLEKLSGPGDFTGYEVGLKLWCQYEEVPDVAEKRTAVGVSLPCLFKNQVADSRRSVNNSVITVRRKGAMKAIDLTRRIFALGVGVSYLRGRNDLPYEPSDEHVDRTIQVVAVEAFFDHRVTSRVDAGVAFGPNLFLVPAFENFTRWSVEPRVTLKLFDLRRGEGDQNVYLGTASLRIGLLTFAKEFVAADFGATGSYRSGTEIGPSVRFILDFDRNPLKSR